MESLINDISLLEPLYGNFIREFEKSIFNQTDFLYKREQFFQLLKM